MQYWRAQTKDQLENCFKHLRDSMPESGWRIEWKPWRDIRSLSQNAFQHVIYAEISQYLIGKGRTDCDEQWVKKMLKNRFIGWVDEEFTDVVTGQKTIRSVLKSTKKLDVGEATHYIDQILAWAADIGCWIQIPAHSEYAKYKESQDL